MNTNGKSVAVVQNDGKVLLCRRHWKMKNFPRFSASDDNTLAGRRIFPDPSNERVYNVVWSLYSLLFFDNVPHIPISPLPGAVELKIPIWDKSSASNSLVVG